MAGRHGSVPPTGHPGAPHRRTVQREDTRLLLVWFVVFAVMLGGVAAFHTLYRWAGPHPRVTAAVRRAKHHARWLIPGLKSRPNAPPAD